MIGPYRAKRVGSEASLKQLGVPEFVCVCMLLDRIWVHFQYILGFLLGHFLAKKFWKKYFTKQIIFRVVICYRRIFKSYMQAGHINTHFHIKPGFISGWFYSENELPTEQHIYLRDIPIFIPYMYTRYIVIFNNTKYMPSQVVRSCVPAYMAVRPMPDIYNVLSSSNCVCFSTC